MLGGGARNSATPSVLALSRQALPALRTTPSDENLSAKGAYVLRETDGPRDVTLLATGSEVETGDRGGRQLPRRASKAAVVSMPCWELFERQSEAYRRDVLGTAPRVGVEAALRFGWDRWIGERGAFVGMTGFGASAPAGSSTSSSASPPRPWSPPQKPCSRRNEDMARITLRQLLDCAAERSYGVPAFNINNMEQALAIMEAARSVNAPVIIQASRGARAYAGDIMFAKMMEALEAMYPEIPLCIHQDHGERVSTCLSAIQNGFTSVMMDGSLKEDGKTPGSYDYNVAITSEVTRLAHMVGASVEGELGCLGSLETGHGEAEDGHGFEGKLDRASLLTDPDEAQRFVDGDQGRRAGGRHRHLARRL